MTADRLRELLTYDPATGFFRWRVSPSHGTPIGAIAGSVYKNGRRYIAIDGRRHFASQLAWLYVYGEWPAGQIDHRNLNKLDDRIDNLRPATNQQNGANKCALKNNLLGVKGVGIPYQPRRPDTPIRYRARIRVNDKLIHLGYYPTPEAANEAYAAAARQYFGEFARSA